MKILNRLEKAVPQRNRQFTMLIEDMHTSQVINTSQLMLK